MARRIAAAALAVPVSIALAAGAQAGIDVGGATGVDTAYTPVAKEAPGLVAQVAGAQFNRRNPGDPLPHPPGSPTSDETTFRAVSFRSSMRGFAAGTERDGDAEVPVVYSYSERDGWKKDDGFPGADSGYVGAVAWIDDDRALAVGGTGAYPEREEVGVNCAEGNAPADDQAGAALAWMYDAGTWRRLEQTEIPSSMRGLTALDFHPPSPTRPVEFGAAGGLCQLWHWQDGGFERNDTGAFRQPFSAESDGTRKLAALTYRVRSIRFSRLAEVPSLPPISPDQRVLEGFAVTSGCCLADPALGALGRPVTLEFKPPDPGQAPGEGTWGEAYPRPPEPRSASPDSHYSVTVTRSWRYDTSENRSGQTVLVPELELKRPGAVTNPGGPAADDDAGRALEPSPTVGEGPHAAVYGVRQSGVARPNQTWVNPVRLLDGAGDIGGAEYWTNAEASNWVVTVGGVEPEIAAVKTQGESPYEHERRLNQQPKEHDRNAPGPPDRPYYDIGAKAGGKRNTGPDGIPDWVIGVETKTGQGVLYATDPQQVPPPPPAVEPVPPIRNCVGNGFNLYADLTGQDSAGQKAPQDPTHRALCQAARSSEQAGKIADSEREDPASRVNPQRPVDGAKSHKLLAVPSYGLNAVDMLDSDGLGWAVGDRGAIVRIQPDRAEAPTVAEPAPADLGAPKRATAPARGAWRKDPLPRGKPGAIPAISNQPTEALRESKMQVVQSLPKPSSDDVSQIVMSLDGSEGWAIGSLPLFHYDGSRWNACDPDVADESKLPDPACRGVAELKRGGLSIVDATRIPHERGTDPSRSHEFELVASTNYIYQGSGAHKAIVHYRNNRWEMESPDRTENVASAGIRFADVAFTAPDDGWILAPRFTSYSGPQRFLHFDGKDWTLCAANCDPNKRLPASETEGNVHGITAVGGRLYAYGERRAGVSSNASNGVSSATPPRPMIMWRRGGSPDDPAHAWRTAPGPGEYDPGHPSLAGEGDSTTGSVRHVALAPTADGRAEGWVFRDPDARHRLLRLHDDRFTPVPDAGVFAQDIERIGGPNVNVAERLRDGRSSFWSATDGLPQFSTPALIRHDETQGQWVPVAHELPLKASMGFFPTNHGPAVEIRAMTGDGMGGVWLAAEPARNDGSVYLLRHTTSRPKPVFEEVPHPWASPRRHITAMTAVGDGTVWAATDSGRLLRYDRGLGWDGVSIPGWDLGRVVTRPSTAYALDVNAHGQGLVVGLRGRIARIDGDEVALDPAAGILCQAAPVPPCATGRDLLSVSVADDGSAVIGGASRALLWRPPAGQLRTVSPPDLADGVSLIDVEHMPDGDVLVLASTGHLYRGQVSAQGATWQLETVRAGLRAVAVGDDGSAVAVGLGGAIYERGSDAAWAPAPSPTGEDLLSVEMRGEAVLVGGTNALLLTRTGDAFEIARPPDFRLPAAGTPISRAITSLAITGGPSDGQVEAWAASPGLPLAPETRLLLHHAGDDDPLLRPTERVHALPDAPAPRSDELALAAFGKSDCQTVDAVPCIVRHGSAEYSEVIGRRIVDALAARKNGPAPPAFAVFSGDAVDAAGYPGNEPAHRTAGWPANFTDGLQGTPAHGARKLHAWGLHLADPLTAAGVPLMSAVGGQDVSDVAFCETVRCHSMKRYMQVAPGENLAWRDAHEKRPAPWGPISRPAGDRLTYRRVSEGVTAVSVRERKVPRDVEKNSELPKRLPGGGAPTHYALDVIDRDRKRNREVARIVVVDNSLLSLAASDPTQNPVEAQGQAAWLERMLCLKGQAEGINCDRRPHQPAIVVANAPPYTYGPGPNKLATDGAAMEAILMRHDADVLVSGRIGWNSIYWATAPGLHYPCPGGSYPDGPPPEGLGVCGQTGGDSSDPTTAGGEVSQALESTGAPVEQVESLLSQAPSTAVDALPVVVASGAGGRLFDDFGSAGDGFWHGYSVVRLDPSGDGRKIVVEQRPVYDWVGIEAQERTLRPGQRMTLRGYARGPMGQRLGAAWRYTPVVRTDRIDSPAVTHRYALLEADPEKPWAPRVDADGRYVPLDPAVGTIDAQTGNVRAGRGNHPRAHAIGTLSLGCVARSGADAACDAADPNIHAASYPLVFEPRNTFQPKVTAAPPQGARVTVQSAQAGIAPPPSPGAPPTVGSLSPPALPSFPSMQPPPALPPVGQPLPTAPPAPPASVAPSALQIAGAPVGLTVAPPAAVIPPPAPPINPAPPGGARKEARQRQAATEKSGADGAQSGVQEGHDVDIASKPPNPDAAMTRRERAKPEGSFTAVSRAEQPSAWARGAVYGGGLTVMALLATGLWVGRPRPRPRPPAVPAPARSSVSTRWRIR